MDTNTQEQVPTVTQAQEPKGEQPQQVLTAASPAEIEEVLKESGIEARPGDYMDRMLQMAKSYNGWNFISISMLKSYTDNPKTIFERSTLATTLRRINMFKYPKKEQFVEVFVGSPVAFVQVHKKLPVLAEDGVYTSLDGNGNFFETRAVTEFLLTDEAIKNFKPFILLKSQGKIGLMYGNPYPSVHTAALAAAAAKAMEMKKEQQ